MLRAGCSAVFADVNVGWTDSPFGYLSRDTDVEAASVSESYLKTGRVVSVDDSQMGWSRYAQAREASMAFHGLPLTFHGLPSPSTHLAWPSIAFHSPSMAFHSPSMAFHGLPLTFHGLSAGLPLTFHSPSIAFHSPSTDLPLTFHGLSAGLPLTFQRPSMAFHRPSTDLPRPSMTFHRPSTDFPWMRWSLDAQSLAISAINPKLFYAAATHEAANLMSFMRLRFDSSTAHRSSSAHAEPSEECASPLISADLR